MKVAASHDLSGLLTLLQYGDSAYPAGGYAHSWGLETAVTEGHVRDAATLAQACRSLLRHGVGRTDAVAAAGCCLAAFSQDTERVTLIDWQLSATRAAREPREASTKIGRRLVETAARAERDPWLAELRAAVRTGEMPGNHACIAGAVASLAGLLPAAAASLTLWSAASGFLNAAPRLLRVTHDDVQAILVALRPLMAWLAGEAAAADPLQMAGGAPQFDIWAMRHELATVRLFAS